MQDGLDIRLLTVAQLLDDAKLPDRVPELASVSELPLPPARDRDAPHSRRTHGERHCHRVGSVGDPRP